MLLPELQRVLSSSSSPSPGNGFLQEGGCSACARAVHCADSMLDMCFHSLSWQYPQTNYLLPQNHSQGIGPR